MWASTESKIGKIRNIIDENEAASKHEVLLGEIDLTGKHDFMDGFLTQVMLDYNIATDELSVILIDATSQA